MRVLMIDTKNTYLEYIFRIHIDKYVFFKKHIPESSKGVKFVLLNHQKQTWGLKFDTLAGSRYVHIQSEKKYTSSMPPSMVLTAWHAPGITKSPGGTRWDLRPGTPGAFEAFFNASLDDGNSNIFLFSPRNLGKMNPIWRACFFRWVGSTTN